MDNSNIPKEVIDAMAAVAWSDPGPAALRRLLGEDLELPDLELFVGTEMMERVAAQLDKAGYVDDPEFCMVRDRELGCEGRDPRLVFEDALFIAGSKVPGDDVFVVIDLRGRNGELEVRAFDWRVEVPQRWVLVGPFGEFVERFFKLCE